MTFRKCRVCGEEKIIWDLDESGACEDSCFASYDKHVGIKLAAPNATVEQRKKIIDAALELCKAAGPARKAAEVLRHAEFDVHMQGSRGHMAFTPHEMRKPPYIEKTVGDFVGRLHEQFGFTQPEDGSANRYDERSARQTPTRHTFWWLLHNCVAHPLIGVVPRRFAFEFHDWTSRKLHGK